MPEADIAQTFGNGYKVLILNIHYNETGLDTMSNPVSIKDQY